MDNTGVTAGTTTWTPIYDALVASLSAGAAEPPRPQAPEPPGQAELALLPGPRPRLAEATMRVVRAAEREAHHLGHDRLGVGHLVLGLLLTDGPEAGHLRRAGLDLPALRRYLEDAGHRARSAAGQVWRGVAPTLIWTSAAAAALAAARSRADDAGRGEALPGDLLDALTVRPAAWAPAVDDAPRLSA